MRFYQTELFYLKCILNIKKYFSLLYFQWNICKRVKKNKNFHMMKIILNDPKKILPKVSVVESDSSGKQPKILDKYC